MIFFIDESGHDHRESPYEVLGGIAIPQSELWAFICAIRELAKRHFGDDRLWSRQEIKGTKLLKRDRLRQAYGPIIPIEERRRLIQEFYQFSVNENDKLRRYHFAAYAQSCRFFCLDMLQTCQDHSARVLAAIIHPDATPQLPTILRADYVGIFHQLYEHSGANQDRRSLIIHDERDDSQCRELARQLYVYYVSEGQEVAQRVVPEPLFVKSHLTLGVLVADVVAYILAWGFRYAEVLNQRYRPDLAEFAELIKHINQMPEVEPENLEAYGIVYLENLGDLQRWSN